MQTDYPANSISETLHAQHGSMQDDFRLFPSAVASEFSRARDAAAADQWVRGLTRLNHVAGLRPDSVPP